MEITELVNVVRFVFAASLLLALILSATGLLAQPVRIVYEKLKRPQEKRTGLLATEPGAAAKH